MYRVEIWSYTLPLSIMQKALTNIVSTTHVPEVHVNLMLLKRVAGEGVTEIKIVASVHCTHYLYIKAQSSEIF